MAVAGTDRRPVKMLWSREEDFGIGSTYSPLGLFTGKAALDADG
jgi:hypothetical protein